MPINSGILAIVHHHLQCTGHDVQGHVFLYNLPTENKLDTRSTCLDSTPILWLSIFHSMPQPAPGALLSPHMWLFLCLDQCVAGPYYPQRSGQPGSSCCEGLTHKFFHCGPLCSGARLSFSWSITLLPSCQDRLLEEDQMTIKDQITMLHCCTWCRGGTTFARWPPAG